MAVKVIETPDPTTLDHKTYNIFVNIVLILSVFLFVFLDVLIRGLGEDSIGLRVALDWVI